MSDNFILVWREHPKGLLSTLVDEQIPPKVLEGDINQFLDRFTLLIQDGDQLVRYLAKETSIEPFLIPVELARNILGWDL